MHLKSSGQLHHISGSSANHPANSGKPWSLSITERSPRKAERGRTCGCCLQAKGNLVILAPWCSCKEPKGKHLCACTHDSVQSLVGNLLATDLVRKNVVEKGAEIISRSPPTPWEAFILKSCLEATNFTHRSTAVLKVMKIHTVVSKSEENCVNCTSPKTLKSIVF